MMISTFTHSWPCAVPENILASVFDDLPIFLVMFNDLFDSQVSVLSEIAQQKEIRHVSRTFSYTADE